MESGGAPLDDNQGMLCVVRRRSDLRKQGWSNDVKGQRIRQKRRGLNTRKAVEENNPVISGNILTSCSGSILPPLIGSQPRNITSYKGKGRVQTRGNRRGGAPPYRIWGVLRGTRTSDDPPGEGPANDRISILSMRKI